MTKTSSPLRPTTIAKTSVEGTMTTMAHSSLVSRLLRRFGQIVDTLSRWTADHDKYDDDNDGLSSRRRRSTVLGFDKDSVKLAKAEARLRA